MFTIQRVSESAFLIEVSESDLPVSLKNQWIALWYKSLSTLSQTDMDKVGMLELTPSYSTLLVEFDIQQCPFLIKQFLTNKLEVTSVGGTTDFEGKADASLQEITEANQIDTQKITHTIPVCFELDNGSEYPNDLESFHKQIDVENIFCNKPYRIYSVGFLPNFAYLGEIDEVLQLPRLTTPRNRVPKGAVAIADKQAAIYPIESKGGWNILGYTPVDVNCLSNPFNIGDSVIFEKISKQQFLSWNQPLFDTSISTSPMPRSV